MWTLSWRNFPKKKLHLSIFYVEKKNNLLPTHLHFRRSFFYSTWLNEDGTGQNKRLFSQTFLFISHTAKFSRGLKHLYREENLTLLFPNSLILNWTICAFWITVKMVDLWFHIPVYSIECLIAGWHYSITILCHKSAFTITPTVIHFLFVNLIHFNFNFKILFSYKSGG
jgi:hypothetical protein